MTSNDSSARNGLPADKEGVLDGQTVAIVGLGASGVAAARLARHHGADCYASDLRTDGAAAVAARELRELGVDVDLGSHDVARIAASDRVVVSPGIPPGAPVLAQLRQRAIGWVSEPEFAFRFFRSPLILVTGTNGKTTTAALSAHLLEAGGLSVGLGGNIGAGLGPAASDLARSEPVPDWVVLEMSSFQLADTRELRADIGVVTNLAPDHLDRYDSVEAYFADKRRIFANADDESIWVLGRTPEVEALAEGVPGRRFGFGLEPSTEPGAWVEGGRMVLNLDDGIEDLGPGEALAILGAHNHRNALAAALVARLAGVTPQDVREGLRSFEPLPHRLAPVLERAGVLWVDDSKGTNVAATTSAIVSLERPLVLLLGGKDKGEDYGPLRDAMRHRVRLAILYGETAARLERELTGAAPLLRLASDFGEVVRSAAQAARSGDVVLLSPATSSYDMFSNYEERGKAFIRLAHEEA